MHHQLELFAARAENTPVPPSERPKRKSPVGPVESASQPDTASKRADVPSHRAPRGDLFRELFEVHRRVALAERPDQRTFEDERADLYWRLHWHSIFRGRKKLKGPIDGLKRKVGRNRFAEFDQWLRQIGAKGSSTAVRYRRVLATIEREIRNVDTSFRYLETEGASSGFTPARWAFSRVEKAETDVGELKELFADVGVLYRQLRKARLESAQVLRTE
jgi:hypothetical protein